MGNRTTARTTFAATSAALGLAALALAGCAGGPEVPRPTAQIAAATTAINTASRMDAAQAAPVPFQSAQAKLTAAENAERNGDYLMARRLATEAQVDAQLAETTARATQAQKAASAVNQGINALQNTTEQNTPR